MAAIERRGRAVEAHLLRAALKYSRSRLPIQDQLLTPMSEVVHDIDWKDKQAHPA